MLKENIYKQALQDFKREGICIVKDLFSSSEVKIFQDETQRLWSEQKNLNPYNLRIGLRKDLNGKDILERLDPVSDISEVFSNFNNDNRILQIAKGILQAPTIILKEKLIYKWPGSSGYGAHRDATYFSVTKEGPSGNEIISMALFLDKTNSENGSIKFYPNLKHTKLAAPKEEPRDIDNKVLEKYTALQPTLEPGDIVIFDGLTPHSSNFNKSNSPRRVYMITFSLQKFPNCRKDYYTFRHSELSKNRRKDYNGNFYLI